jgi:hypothetical protein
VRRFRFVAGVTAAGVLVVSLGVAWMARAQSADAHFDVTGWGSDATLRLRQDGDALLFAPGIRYVEPPTNMPREEAYRFDPDRRELTPVPAATWTAAAGAIVDCDRAGLVASRVQVDSGELRVDGRVVAGSGRVRHARLSPDGRLVAVLTASGIPVPSFSIVPALGGSAVVGWRRHRLFVPSSGAPVGAAIDIDFGVSDPVPCWSADGRIITYADAAFTRIAFVFIP